MALKNGYFPLTKKFGINNFKIPFFFVSNLVIEISYFINEFISLGNYLLFWLSNSNWNSFI